MTDQSDFKTMTRLDRRRFLGSLLEAGVALGVIGTLGIQKNKLPWRTCELYTETTITRIDSASLDAGQSLLPAGTYWMKAGGLTRTFHSDGTTPVQLS